MISFIVPAHNEERFIAATLQSIHSAAGAIRQPYEIIVVDDASTDGTAALAVANGARVVSVQLRKISAVRNAGAKVARGDRLVFVDADTTISARLLAAAMAVMERGAVGGGAVVAYDQAPRLWAKVLLRYWNTLSRFMRWAAGCFIFVRRDIFEAVGGFDEHFFAAEELVLSETLKRVGRFNILLEPSTTSSRKTVHYSLVEVLMLSARIMAAGEPALQQREGLELWYNRREAPVPAR